DSTGNLFATSSSNVILKFTPDGTQSTFATTVREPNPCPLAFDSAGNLFVGINDTIYKYAPDGTQTIFAIGINGGVTALAFEPTPHCTPAPSGLVSWWPLDETSGTTANDIRGSNNGTLNGTTAVEGK